MDKTQLKYEVMNTGSHFFDRATMRFFGDTMANYYCHKNPVKIKRSDEKYYECWELSRTRAVKHNLTGSAYFSTKDFEHIIPAN